MIYTLLKSSICRYYAYVAIFKYLKYCFLSVCYLSKLSPKNFVTLHCASYPSVISVGVYSENGLSYD